MDKYLFECLEREQKKNVVIYGMTKEKRGMKSIIPAFLNVYYMDLGADNIMKHERLLCSLEQACEMKIDSFILTKQMISRQDIFGKLMEYCKEHDADIYDERGRKISEICQKALKCEVCTKEQLIEQIKEHECISFDIFDTLLTRKVLLPEDVFELTAQRAEKKGIVIKNFKEKRIKAQQALGLTNPDIYDIYEKFHRMYKIPKDILDICLAIEIQTERDVLIVREEMLEVYDACCKLGKKVAIVSDMYIPEYLLKDILKEKGITGYDKLYVSCDKKQLKLQGLLETYRMETGASSYLHIGDHIIHDGICAGLAGMHYCLVANSFKTAKKTVLGECIQKAEVLEERVMLGLIIAKLLNSPFRKVEKSGKPIVKSDYEYSYCFCATLICHYVMWMYDEIKRENYDEVLFGARDGYLIQKMYKMLLEKTCNNDMPKGQYFYTSRKAAVMACINNEAFINMIIDISEGIKPRRIMKDRFGLPDKSILPYDVEKYGDSIHKYVWEHAEAIFKRADEAKLNYFRYMGNIGLQIGKKYAFMDFVSSGTVQKSLKRIAPFEIIGLYMGWNGTESREEVGVRSLYEGTDTYFMRHFKMMETFMTSEEASLSYFDMDGKPVFAKQDRTKQELDYVAKMQNACLDFFAEYLDIIEVKEDAISNVFADSVFASGGGIRIENLESVINHLTLMDDWRQKKNKLKELME